MVFCSKSSFNIKPVVPSYFTSVDHCFTSVDHYFTSVDHFLYLWIAILQRWLTILHLWITIYICGSLFYISGPLGNAPRTATLNRDDSVEVRNAAHTRHVSSHLTFRDFVIGHENFEYLDREQGK